MKIKSKIMIVLIFSILVLFLKKHNVLQIEKHYVNTMIILLIILLFSILLILTQYKLDKNYLKEEMQYQNLNVLKYLCSIFVIILHIRLFISASAQLDLALIILSQKLVFQSFS